MMKRKWINIIAAVLLISTITGCGKKDVIKDEPVQEMVYDLTDFEISGDGIENQSYWKAMAHCYAAADNGYYYAAEEKGTLILLYYDKDSKQWIHLCNKPECEHNGSDCNAYYSGYIMSSVWRYKEYIYTIALNNGQGILVRSNLDGSDRQELFEIGSADSAANIFRLAFSDDCVYITTAYGNSGMENIKEVSVRKRSLDGKQDVNIYTSTDKDVVIESVKCYGSQVFFVVENITRDEETYRNKTTSKGLYCYDSKKNVVGKVFDEAVCDYAIDYEKKKYIIM